MTEVAEATEPPPRPSHTCRVQPSAHLSKTKDDMDNGNLRSALEGDVRETRPLDRIGGDELRMWLFVRKDLPMPAGKLAAQAGHGYVTCLWLAGKVDPGLVERYMEQAQGKIAVGVRDGAELVSAVEACRAAGLPAVTVTDAAHTVFSEPVMTVGAVGPCLRGDLPGKVRRLRLFEGWSNDGLGGAAPDSVRT